MVETNDKKKIEEIVEQVRIGLQMDGGDMEYVEWAGEAKMMAGLQTELAELTDVRYHLH